MSEHIRNPNNYIPIEQPTFQSAAAPARILGRAGLRIATLRVSRLPYFNLCLTHFNLCFTQSAMPCLSDEEDIQLPSDPDFITPPTDRRKCGAERVSFSGEGSISVPSPVKEIIFEKQGRAQEQSTLRAAHVTAIGYRPALRYPTSYSIPSPVKRIQAPQSQLISDDDEDYEWKVIAEYATNHQQAMDAHEIVDDIYRHAENFMHASGR
jgi:hypothetical protein